MGTDHIFNFSQIRGGKVSWNRIFHCAGGVADLKRSLTVLRVEEQSEKNAGYIGVSASDPVHHLYIPIGFLFIEMIAAGVIDDGTKGMDLRAVHNTLSGGYDGNRIIFCKALHNAFCIAFFQECKPGGFLRTEEDIYIGKDLLKLFSCLVAGPEVAAEIYIKRNERAAFFEPTDHFHTGPATFGTESECDPACVKASGGSKQRVLEIFD